MNNCYVSMLKNSNTGTGYVPVFAVSLGGETAGSVANSFGGNSSSSTGYYGGETAGSVACSSGCTGGGSSCGGGSFSAIC